MYFTASYLKPLENFRSKEQIISCIRSLNNCLNYPNSLLRVEACDLGSASDPGWHLPQLEPCAVIGPGLRGEGSPRPVGEEGQYYRVMSRVRTRMKKAGHPGCRNAGTPDSQASTQPLYGPENGHSFSAAARAPCLITLVTALEMSTSSEPRLPGLIRLCHRLAK